MTCGRLVLLVFVVLKSASGVCVVVQAPSGHDDDRQLHALGVSARLLHGAHEGRASAQLLPLGHWQPPRWPGGTARRDTVTGLQPHHGLLVRSCPQMPLLHPPSPEYHAPSTVTPRHDACSMHDTHPVQ